MITLDGNGIAAAIAAGCAGVVSLGTFAMQVISWRDAREIKRLSLARDVQIREVKDLVNGRSVEHTAMVAEKSFAAGRSFERDTPNQPSPAVAVVTPDGAGTAPQIVPVKVPDNS